MHKYFIGLRSTMVQNFASSNKLFVHCFLRVHNLNLTRQQKTEICFVTYTNVKKMMKSKSGFVLFFSSWHGDLLPEVCCENPMVGFLGALPPVSPVGLWCFAEGPTGVF